MLYAFLFHHTEYLKMHTQGSRCHKMSTFSVSSVTFLSAAGLKKKLCDNEECTISTIWLTLCQQLYLPLLLHHQRKYQHSENGQQCLTIKKTVLICGPPEKVWGTPRRSWITL